MRAVLKAVAKADGVKPLPQVSSENTFSALEYAKAIGLKESAARDRIKKLVAAGQVRRVRNVQGLQAFEWIGE